MILPCPSWRRMRRVELPPGFQIVPHDSRYYAVYEKETLICVCVYKSGARALVRRLAEEKR